MIIRIILIVLICALLLWFLRQRSSNSTRAWGKIGVLLVFGLAVIAIIFPDTTNDLAHAVGVGRGADLLLYGVTIMVFASSLMNYFHRRDDQAKIVNLSRRLSILEAEQNSHNQNILTKTQTKK